MIRVIAFAFVLALAFVVPSFAQTTNLYGTYAVTGVSNDGKPYESEGVVSVSADPSGALLVNWDNGEYIGIGQVSGNMLAIAVVVEKRNAVQLMTINPDGSLSGSWWRRTEPGVGSENWKRK
ncbi:Bulb-type lectin domain-containing protein [Azospirillaceae bacterium]